MMTASKGRLSTEYYLKEIVECIRLHKIEHILRSKKTFLGMMIAGLLLAFGFLLMLARFVFFERPISSIH